MEDLIGQKFSRLTVLAQFRKNNHSYCHCRCDCGKEKDVRQDHLKSGKIESCGCLQKERASEVPDITGQTFGSWTVLQHVPNPHSTTKRGAYWLCRCICGTERIVSGPDLRSGNSQSCGCTRGETMVKDLTNQRFGKLTVIKRDTTKPKGQGAFWLCQCDCGNVTSVRGYHLTSHKTSSCGCLQSYGEMVIRQLLDTLSYDYQTQYSFSDLKDKDVLRFDFAIFEHKQLMCVIEVQGIQHYQSDINKYGWNTPEHLAVTQLHDQMKQEYCQAHQIPLIAIPYTEITAITADILKEKIENDRIYTRT